MIEKAVQEMPERRLELHGPIVEIRERFQPHGIKPIEVARVVKHAITSKKPKTRYVVGKDAKLLDLIRRLPTPVRYWVIDSQLPEYGEN